MMNLLHLVDRFSQLRVLVIGEAMLDSYLHGSADRLCQEAPVPVVNVTERQEAPGGAANTAANLASLGSEVQFLSVLGQDTEGDRLCEALRQCRVNCDMVLATAARQTLSKQRVVAASQLLVRFDQGSTDALSPEIEQQVIDQLTQLFSSCDAVVVSDYSYGILTPRVIAALAHLQAVQPRTIVVDSKRLAAYQAVRPVAVKPNYEEAIQLLGLPRQSGTSRIQQMQTCELQLLETTGAAIVAVTLDREGAILLEQGCSPLYFATRPGSNRQAVGAGDTFISVLALALAAGAKPQTAAHLAVAATEIVVSQEGTSTCSGTALRQALLEKVNITSEVRWSEEERHLSDTPVSLK